MLFVSTFRGKCVLACLLLASICKPYTGANADECSGKCENSGGTAVIRCADCRWDASLNKCSWSEFACGQIDIQKLLDKHSAKADPTDQIKAFQKEHKLEPTGIIDKETLKSLQE